MASSIGACAANAFKQTSSHALQNAKQIARKSKLTREQEKLRYNGQSQWTYRFCQALLLHSWILLLDRHGEIVYARTFRLDASMDAAKIQAKISGGVLEVHLPKSEPYRVRKIEVTGS